MSTRTVVLWIVGTSYLYVFAAPNSQRSTVYPMLSNDYELTPSMKVSGESGLDEEMYQNYDTDHSNSVSGEKDIGETTLFDDLSHNKLVETVSMKAHSIGVEDHSISGESDLRDKTYVTSLVGLNSKLEETSSILFPTDHSKLNDKDATSLTNTHSQNLPSTHLNDADDISDPSHSSGIDISEFYSNRKRTSPLIPMGARVQTTAQQNTIVNEFRITTMSDVTDTDRPTPNTNTQVPIVNEYQPTFSVITDESSTDESFVDNPQGHSVNDPLFSTIKQNDVTLPKDVWQTQHSHNISSSEPPIAPNKTTKVKTKLQPEDEPTLKVQTTTPSSSIPSSRFSLVSPTLRDLINSNTDRLTSIKYPTKSRSSSSNSKATVPSTLTSVSFSSSDQPTSSDDQPSTIESKGIKIFNDYETTTIQMNGSKVSSDNQTFSTQRNDLLTSSEYETSSSYVTYLEKSSNYETTTTPMSGVDTSDYKPSTTQQNLLNASTDKHTFSSVFGQNTDKMPTTLDSVKSTYNKMTDYMASTIPHKEIKTSFDQQIFTTHLSGLKTSNDHTLHSQAPTTETSSVQTLSDDQTPTDNVNTGNTSVYQAPTTTEIQDLKTSSGYKTSTTETNYVKTSSDFQIFTTKTNGLNTLSDDRISTQMKDIETSSEYQTTTDHYTIRPTTEDSVTSGSDDALFSDSTPVMSTSKESESSHDTSTTHQKTTEKMDTDLPTTHVRSTTTRTTEDTATASTASTSTKTPMSTASRRSTTDERAPTILTTPRIQTTDTTLTTGHEITSTSTAYLPTSTTVKCTDNEFMHNFKCVAVEELAPWNVTVKMTEKKRYEVKWEISNIASEVFTNYMVIWRNTTSSYNSTSSVCNDTQCTQIIKHTPPGTVWNVSVIAQTSFGYSMGASVLLWTDPSEPTDTSVRGLNETCLTISWQQGIGCAERFLIRVMSSAGSIYHKVQNRCDIHRRGYTMNACGLKPSSVYNISISSVNGPSLSKEVMKYGVTLPAPVRDLKVLANETIILAQWKYRQGTVKVEFNITILTGKQNILIKTTDNRFTQGGLEPGTCYDVQVKAVNRAGVSQGIAEKICTQESIPTTPVRPITLVDVTARSIHLQWKSPERPNGVITRYLIKYCLHHAQSHDVTDPHSCSIESTPSNATTFTVKHLLPFQKYSIRILPSTRRGNGTSWSDHLFVTTLEEVPGKVSSVKIQSLKRKLIHISWSAPVKSNGIIVSYFVNITAINCTYKKVITVNKTISLSVDVIPNCQYRIQVSAATKVGTGLADSYLILVRKIKHEGDGSDSGGSSLIIGLVASAVILLLLAALTFVLFKIWKKKVPPKPRVSISIKNEEFIDMEKSMTNLSKTRSIKVQNFICHVDDMHRTSNIGFSEEYKIIKQLSPKYSTKSAEQEACRTKNRYTNVLAFDHSRVKLLPQDDDEGSDYINANYITGYNGKREYIAAQGPLPCTKDDFWRLIWENKVSVVVMLTQCMERGRIKCEKYWPDTNEPVYFGDLVVQLRSESVLPDYVIRILDVTQGSIKRVVKHFHFLKWPDFGCPEKTWLLLNFVCAVRSHMPHTQHGPTLVHCSAGVGRTGTFIAVDYELQNIKDHSEIDIFGLVVDMREHRPLMVQTENQYVYIHDCIRDALVDDTDEEASLLDEENGEPLYQNL